MAGPSMHDLDAVRRALAEVMMAGARRAAAQGAEMAELWDLAAEGIGGGKLERPRILLEMVRALTGASGSCGSDETQVARIAAALEVLHYAFLLHDDVIDEDLIRRGRNNLIGELLERARSRDGASGPAVGTRGDALHWARSAAILMGDLMLTTAHLLIARADIEAPRRAALLDLLEEATLTTVSGEHLDVSFADGISVPDVAMVCDMACRKTAAYTFELPLRMAAVLTGRTDVDGPLHRAGRHLGLAYQLQDDLLSAFGDPADHGKDSLSDLREGKQTVLVAIARSRPAWAAIREDLGRADLTPPEADALRGLLAECGARAEVERLIATEIHEARAALEDEDRVPRAAVATMDDLIGRLDRRVA